MSAFLSTSGRKSGFLKYCWEAFSFFPSFPFSLPWQTVINWSLIWLSFCQTEPSLSTQSPKWARDLPGHVILHVPSAWNSPPLTAQRSNPTQQEHVSHMSHCSLSLIFLLAVCGALWALGIIRIYLAVLKSSMLLKWQKTNMFPCSLHEQFGQRHGLADLSETWTAEWSLHTQEQDLLFQFSFSLFT